MCSGSLLAFHYTDGSIEVTVIVGKRRIAPLKTQSIPRMALQAALLCSRLARTIEAEHDFQVNKRSFWTDPRTVMLWINSGASTYKAFISHRLNEIDELCKEEDRKWTPTVENPANIATREKEPIKECLKIWNVGPVFLSKNELEWSKQPDRQKGYDSQAQRIKDFIGFTSEMRLLQLPDNNYFSKWLCLVRSIAWVLLTPEIWLRKR